MADREKVIKGLEYCNQVEDECEVCPYYNDFNGCMLELREDALAMLKEQEQEIEHRRHLCKCLFNRCYTINRGEMCKYCACRDECEKERTVDKDA